MLNGSNFKKSIVVLSAIAASAMALNAMEIAKIKNTTVDLYGVAAISVVNYSDGDKGPVVENESRVGFKARKDLSNGKQIFMQIESGWADNGSNGKFGDRDTFIGLKGDFGTVRVGKMLTPIYQIIDWPYSNPGLGRVFDWGGAVKANYDRQSNMLRYDSNSSNGFAYSLAAGRNTGINTDTNKIKGASGDATKDSFFFGGSATYAVNKQVTLLAGLESAEKFKGTNADTLALLSGFDANFDGGFGLAGAYKMSESKDAGIKKSQNAFSVIGKYSTGKLQYKLGYASAGDSETGSLKNTDAKDVISGQILYFLDDVAIYGRIAKFGSDKVGDNSNVITRLGVEYSF